MVVTPRGRLAQWVRAPALQVATSPLLLSHSPLFSIALHPFRNSAFAQHRTLLGCLTCISDTFLAQQEVHGSDCRGRMLCLKIASAGDCDSHSRAEALVCDYQLVHASRIRLGVKEPSDQNIYGAFSGNNPGIHREASAAGNVRRSGARGLSETSTPLSTRAVLEDVTDKPHVVSTKDEHGKWTDANETP